MSNTPNGVQITIAGSLRRRGGLKAVVGWTKDDWRAVRPRLDKAVLGALARAYRWRAAIERGDVAQVQDLADQNALNRRKILPLLRLAFLAPDIQAAIVDGRQPAALNLKRITELNLPSDWQAQRKLLGLAD